MEINNIYINNDIIHQIFNILNIDNQINFSYTNSFMYNLYYNNIKYNIYRYVNKDYLLYKKCINRFNYNETQIKILGMLAISNPNPVFESTIKYYDLRYIFELIMNDLDINNPEIIYVNNSFNMRFILKTIKKCKSFNRFETKNNINNESSLRSLHSLFLHT